MAAQLPVEALALRRMLAPCCMGCIMLQAQISVPGS